MRLFVLLGGVLGFLGMALGAFGAHVLKGRLSAEMLVTFETAARYQLIHALALILVGSLIDRRAHRSLSLAGWLFFTGVVLFSGSLYLLAITGARWLGAITPLGGLAFLAGWGAIVAFGMAES